MVVECQVVRFQKDSSGTTNATQDVNLNFTPKAIIVFSEGNNADNTVSTHYQWGQGFSDGTNHACFAAVSDDADAAGDTAKSYRNDSVFVRLNESFTTITIQSRATCAFATNKVTFTWVVNDTTATYLTLYAFGGDDITNAKVATVDVGRNTAGTQNYTGLGFNPAAGEAVLFTLKSGATASGESDHAHGSFGAAVSSTARWALSVMSENASDPTDTWRTTQTTNCLYELDDTGAEASKADFDGWITDGFTLDWENPATNTTDDFSYLVIKGGKWDCGTLTAPNTPTNDVDTSVSVSSNTLRGLLMVTNNYTDSSITTSNNVSVGATDGTTQASMGTVDEDAQNNADGYRVNSSTHVIRAISTNGVQQHTATFDSFGTNSFRLDWDNAVAFLPLHNWVVVADSVAVAEELLILSGYYASDK